jgi:hypothetical protein
MRRIRTAYNISDITILWMSLQELVAMLGTVEARAGMKKLPKSSFSVVPRACTSEL